MEAAHRAAGAQAKHARESFRERSEGGLRPRRDRRGRPPHVQGQARQPRNKQLLRMMEDPEKRKAVDKAELGFYADSRKEELFALKEELFFTIDEKSMESDLSEQGRTFLNPDDPDAFVLPDLIGEFAEIDLNRTLSDEEKEKQKVEAQQKCDAQAERMHNISQLLRAYCMYE